MTEPMIQEALKAEVLFKQDKAVWWEYEKAEKSRRDRIARENYIESYARNDEKIKLARQLINSGTVTLESLRLSGAYTADELSSI